MAHSNPCYGLLKRLVNDRSGNFGILTAIAVPLLLATAGVAVDVSNMVLSKSQLQAATTRRRWQRQRRWHKGEPRS